MAIYKFRLLLEDYDDFFRDIEIKSSQTFEDFHKIIIETLGFSGQELSSFYICDHLWRKGKEIALMDMTEDGNIETMNKAIIANYIEDPHQRMIYVYDFLDMWTAYIELVKIIPSETKGVKYPCVVKSLGVPPKLKTQNPNAIKNLDDPIFEEELLTQDESELDDEESPSELGEDSGFSEFSEDSEEHS